MFENTVFPDDVRHIVEGLCARTVLGVSNGSYMFRPTQSHSLGSWIIERQHSGAACKEVLPVPGMEDKENTCCAKEMASLAKRWAIRPIAKNGGLSDGYSLLGANNLGIIHGMDEEHPLVSQ